VLAINPYIEYPELAPRLTDSPKTFLKDESRYPFIHGSSADLTAADILPDAAPGFRFFSIDGDHTADFAHHDLSLAHETLVDGGIVALDDYFDSNCPGVSIGTTKFLLDKNDGWSAVLLYAGNKVLLTTAEHHHVYKMLLEKITDIRGHLAHPDVDWFVYPAFAVDGIISGALPG
jgi:hypothetical protein